MDNLIIQAERAAFKQAAALCRKYRKENKILKAIILALLILVIALIAVIL